MGVDPTPADFDRWLASDARSCWSCFFNQRPGCSGIWCDHKDELAVPEPTHQRSRPHHDQCGGPIEGYLCSPEGWYWDTRYHRWLTHTPVMAPRPEWSRPIGTFSDVVTERAWGKSYPVPCSVRSSGQWRWTTPTLAVTEVEKPEVDRLIENNPPRPPPTNHVGEIQIPPGQW